MSIVALGCTSSPNPAPAPAATKFAFPPGDPGRTQPVEQPIPTGIELEYIIPIDKAIAAAKNLELIDIEVRAIDEYRTILATAQLRYSGDENGASLFKGRVNRVIRKGRAKIAITTPHGEGLAHYDATYGE